MKRALIFVLSVLAPAMTAMPASATFHFMQIEQVIGGVDGNTGIQAIQLRMRSVGQNLLAPSRIRAWDAAGANPVTVVDFVASVASGAAGARVLVATAGFQAATTPGLAPDVVMANPIPAAYLPAGSLTFETDLGFVYWRLSWGGASYTGSGVGGDITNDADANYNPPFSGPLPSANGRALQFTGVFSAPSTNNAANYALTAGSATFTRNNGNSAQINSVVGVGDPEIPAIALGPPVPNPARTAVSYTVSLPRAGKVRVTAFDTRGRRVADVLDQQLPGGRHSFTWDIGSDAPSLSSGVYFLALEAEGRRSVRRVVYLRGAQPIHHHGD